MAATPTTPPPPPKPRNLNDVMATARRAAAQLPPAGPAEAPGADPAAAAAAEVPGAEPTPPAAESPPAQAPGGPAAEPPGQPSPPAGEAPGEAEAPAQRPGRPRAEPFRVDESAVLSGASTLQVHEAMKRATAARPGGGGTFKVVALHSGYWAEMSALSFQDVARLQSGTLDAFGQENRLLEILHAHAPRMSCGHLRFQEWKRSTAQADRNSLMYGLYAATYPGDNEFEVACRHCRQPNKVVVDVNRLARSVKTAEVHARVAELLDPMRYEGPPTGSLIGVTGQVRLPVSGIVAEIRNPSIEDHMLEVQRISAMTDRQTGALPDRLEGAGTIRTISMYTGRLLLPLGERYVPVRDDGQKAEAIGRLCEADGRALSAAVDEMVERLGVAYEIPPFQCGKCSKRNEDLALNFENLLFIKLQESA